MAPKRGKKSVDGRIKYILQIILLYFVENKRYVVKSEQKLYYIESKKGVNAKAAIVNASMMHCGFDLLQDYFSTCFSHSFIVRCAMQGDSVSVESEKVYGRFFWCVFCLLLCYTRFSMHKFEVRLFQFTFCARSKIQTNCVTIGSEM